MEALQCLTGKVDNNSIAMIGWCEFVQYIIHIQEGFSTWSNQNDCSGYTASSGLVLSLTHITSVYICVCIYVHVFRAHIL